jgi:hypothetical protein
MKHLAKRALAILMLLLTLTLSLALALPVSADAAAQTPAHTTFETALDLIATAVREHMEKNTDERWYKITVDGAGDAIIVVQSHMDTAEYSENWHAEVYESDGVTKVKGFDIKGGENIKSCRIRAEQASTYYLRIRGLEKESQFDAGEYTVSVVTALDGTEVDYGDCNGGLLTVDKAGTVFFGMGGTYFIKLHDGEAKVALHRKSDGTVCPILMGSTRESVEFVVSSKGNVVHSYDYQSMHDYKGKVYYYSNTESISKYTDEKVSAEDLPIYCSSKGKYGIDEKLEKDLVKQLENEQYNAVSLFFDRYGFGVFLGAIAVALVVVVVVIIIKGKGGDGEDPYRPLYLDMTGDEY